MSSLRQINDNVSRGVSILPKGSILTRVAMAKAVAARGGGSPAEIAAANWGPSSAPAIILRSPVAVGDVTSGNWGALLAEAQHAGRDFVEALRPSTILGKLSNIRRVPMNVRVPQTTAGSTAVAWVGGRGPAPVSAMAFDTIELPPLKIAGLVISTRELQTFAEPSAEALVRSDLLAAVATLSDRALIDPDNAGEAGVSPASVTYGATKIEASGTTSDALKADLRKLFAVLADGGSNFVSPYLITDRRTAVSLNLMDTHFTKDVSVNGGSLAGVPLVTSASSPTEAGNSPPVRTGTIVLVDAAELMIADDGAATIDYSNQADVEMQTAPDSPPTASTVFVSLWQRNMAAWKVVRGINWEMCRSGMVASIINCRYGE